MTKMLYWDIPAGPRTMLIRGRPFRLEMPRVVLVGRRDRHPDAARIEKINKSKPGTGLFALQVARDHQPYAVAVLDEKPISLETPVARHPLSFINQNNVVLNPSHYGPDGRICLDLPSLTGFVCDPMTLPDVYFFTNHSIIPNALERVIFEAERGSPISVPKPTPFPSPIGTTLRAILQVQDVLLDGGTVLMRHNDVELVPAQ